MKITPRVRRLFSSGYPQLSVIPPVLRYRAVVRHLHLVDCAYACLTHVGLEAQRAQGRKDAKNVLRLPPIRQLKQDLRQKIWNEAVKNVVKVSHERAVIRRLEKLLVA